MEQDIAGKVRSLIASYSLINAACKLKLEDYKQVVKLCTKVCGNKALSFFIHSVPTHLLRIALFGRNETTSGSKRASRFFFGLVDVRSSLAQQLSTAFKHTHNSRIFWSTLSCTTNFYTNSTIINRPQKFVDQSESVRREKGRKGVMKRLRFELERILITTKLENEKMNRNRLFIELGRFQRCRRRVERNSGPLTYLTKAWLCISFIVVNGFSKQLFYNLVDHLLLFNVLKISTSRNSVWFYVKYDEKILTIALLNEVAKGKRSWWYPYLTQFPTNYDVLPSFDKFEIQALQISSCTMHIPWDAAGCFCRVGDFFNYAAPDEEQLLSEDSANAYMGAKSLRLTDGVFEEKYDAYCFYARRDYKKGEQLFKVVWMFSGTGYCCLAVAIAYLKKQVMFFIILLCRSDIGASLIETIRKVKWKLKCLISPSFYPGGDDGTHAMLGEELGLRLDWTRSSLTSTQNIVDFGTSASRVCSTLYQNASHESRPGSYFEYPGSLPFMGNVGHGVEHISPLSISDGYHMKMDKKVFIVDPTWMDIIVLQFWIISLIYINLNHSVNVRSDGSEAPPVPGTFLSLVETAIQDYQGYASSAEIPSIYPDICIVNLYTTTGRLGLHQEWPIAMRARIVSKDFDKANKVLLESGDVLIFGGKSRHFYNGVKTIIPKSAPLQLSNETGLRPGRLKS
ncbi:SET domain group 40 [Artemisia annua]|uniref:SET domain group 40 n=1 Tax=Artemisia annua TaxID=35608 RepID=A0A2U1NBS5_ARTAN|nr:SET domain group 40 [Artemisia annua]